jgi:CspA family cold shock protein
LNARQKRLFEEARKRNPNLKLPDEQPKLSPELTEEDLALLKQGVGDKTPRSQQAAAEIPEAPSGGYTGAVVTYFEDKGFGFIRPDGGGKDVFFHVSRLTQGTSADLVPGVRVSYDLGMDRTGKIAVSSLRIAPPA